MHASRRGLLIVYTGSGKGKTTAALGLALRAAGHALRVAVLQFVKARRSGEHEALARLGDLVSIRTVGTGFVVGRPSPEAQAAASEGLALARQLLADGRTDMLVLDELLSALGAGLIAEADVMALIDARPSHVHLVLTGRDAPAAILQRADLATEMRCLKHPFDDGLAAQPGIEF
ncbi:MAG TPA: cob(I)yrinic acid a,c-diamide adenosyltransferase [Phycisphaerae bacterium]|mgnify:CR=1 FL=1|nr:cob(I)yrinic acid a,c-diamide adenosyltransferase [Phycisphaerae bacterium]